jgi:hypothetical protein
LLYECIGDQADMQMCRRRCRLPVSNWRDVLTRLRRRLHKGQFSA